MLQDVASKKWVARLTPERDAHAVCDARRSRRSIVHFMLSASNANGRPNGERAVLASCCFSASYASTNSCIARVSKR